MMPQRLDAVFQIEYMCCFVFHDQDACTSHDALSTMRFNVFHVKELQPAGAMCCCVLVDGEADVPLDPVLREKTNCA
jgi:hypothetical protein